MIIQRFKFEHLTLIDNVSNENIYNVMLMIDSAPPPPILLNNYLISIIVFMSTKVFNLSFFPKRS